MRGARLTRGDQPPEIVVPPPGPESRRLSAELARVEAPGISTLGPRDEPAIVWREALGANVLDVDGNRYVDLTSGFGVALVGHRPPEILEAVARQAGELLHGLGDVAAHPARVALARRLAALAPVDRPRVHFAVSGADAVEVALKAALAATGRAGLLAFDPGYHGLTLGALAAASRAEFRAPFAAALRPGVVRLPFGAEPARIAAALADGAIGAALVEPVVGREGVLPPPPGWLAALAAACRASGTLLIADEVLTGFGRTGAHFVVEAEGVRPDLLCCGKALGGGLPIAATIGRRDLMEVWRSDGEALHTGTHLAHPLACAAALAALGLLIDSRAVAGRAALASQLEAGLGRLAARHRSVVARRSIGLLGALDLGPPGAATRLAAAARGRGILLLAGGASGNVVQLAPPFVITTEQLGAAIDALDAALSQITRGARGHG